MARPMKSGLDYYPMDVGFLRDKKVRLLRSEFGASSVLFVLYVLGRIYEGEGYFLPWDPDERLLAADELRKPPTYIDEVLRGCLSRGLFHQGVFQGFGVLTSPGVQRRYLRGCERREEIPMVEEYWLLDRGSKTEVPQKIGERLVFRTLSGDKNPVSDLKNPKRKGEERKAKQKGEERAGSPASFVPPTLEEVAAYVKARKSPVDPQTWLDYYAARGWRMGQTTMRDWKAAVRGAERWDQWTQTETRKQVKAPKDYEGGESFV